MTSVRQPVNNSPVTSVTSSAVTCNSNAKASTTTLVSAGSTVGFKLDNTVYHQGPAAMYLGKVPSGQTAATWDGSGANWFKVSSLGIALLVLLCSRLWLQIAEWGATFNPFTFTDFNAAQLSTTLPSSIPSGDVRLFRLLASYPVELITMLFSTCFALSRLVSTLPALRSGISPALRSLCRAAAVRTLPRFPFLATSLRVTREFSECQR